jgi:hypothetical protein
MQKRKDGLKERLLSLVANVTPSMKPAESLQHLGSLQWIYERNPLPDGGGRHCSCRIGC